MTSIVRVTAPSRLHFGLLRFAQQRGTSYGGLGMTLDRPQTIVELQSALAWHSEGPMADRALAFAKLAIGSFRPEQDSPLSIRVCEAPQPHSGLGTGTQLALAIARGIRELWKLPSLEAAELSASVGRGKRSAVGSYGFLHGGLIWETGRCAEASLGKLAQRIAMPDHWRVLLITLPEESGLSGDRETTAFKNLPSVPSEVTEQLQCLAEESILPAAEGGDFESFAEAIHEYGRLAGSCFATIQGSSFASPAIEQLVDQLRELGIQGVGQSSWGPTVFALAKDEDQAEELVDRAQNLCECKVQIAAPNNRGAGVLSV